MHESPGPLTLELLSWISERPRTYAEAIEAWGSQCPRHPVWEDALADGLIQIVPRRHDRRATVVLTPGGAALVALPA